MTKDQFKELIIDVPNFPREGIVFKDITPLLETPHAFKQLITQMAAEIPKEVTKIVSIESRGFLLGSALAFASDKGLVLCRKPGKLPRETFSGTYQLEYGQDSLELHKASISKGDHVLIVDDVLATGGTAEAAVKLCESAGAKVSALSFLMELEFLGGSSRLKKYPVNSFLKF
jgi:adenine phosphoribosyltransferase